MQQGSLALTLVNIGQRKGRHRILEHSNKQKLEGKVTLEDLSRLKHALVNRNFDVARTVLTVIRDLDYSYQTEFEDLESLDSFIAWLNEYRKLLLKVEERITVFIK